jgi:hypothetical protein
MGKDGEKFSLKNAYHVLGTRLLNKKIGYLKTGKDTFIK